MRIGYGFDVHAFSQERRLVMGGVEIPDHAGLSGHSDADVLCHAIGDALLGAAALGDLGTHFPGDARWRESSSLEILGEVAGLLSEAGARIENVDATVVCESPRLDPYRDRMIATVAGALGVEPEKVSIKATSTDRLGFTGRAEGIAAHAVALITS
jgi:2-C-methyl-D-erythritol 2,4-cyclodiphosphate synthase